LGTDLRLGLFVEEGSLISEFGKLEAVGGLLHDRVAVYACDPAARMGTRLPVGLNSFLMALQAGLILHLCGLARILAERKLQAYALSPPSSHVLAPRAVAAFAGLFLQIIAGLEKENLSHQGLREFLELRGMARLADLVPHVGRFLTRGDLSGGE